MAEAVIVEAVRSPVGKRNGGLSGVHPAELSAQVLNGLVQRAGVDPARIVAQGYGKEYPVADNGSNSGRAQNRRVEVTISNDNQPVAPRSVSQVQ